jgi:preprotein translocase subunit SecG
VFLLAFLIFVVVAGLLVYFVLLQEPKQGGLSSSVGGAGDFLGGRGVSGGLIRLTVILGGLYIVLSVVLNLIPR